MEGLFAAGMSLIQLIIAGLLTGTALLLVLISLKGLVKLWEAAIADEFADVAYWILAGGALCALYLGYVRSSPIRDSVTAIGCFYLGTLLPFATVHALGRLYRLKGWRTPRLPAVALGRSALMLWLASLFLPVFVDAGGSQYTSGGRLREVMGQQQQQGQQHHDELARLQAAHQAEQQRFAATHAAELERLQAVHAEENAALRAEVSRQADIFDSTSNHLMKETSRVRDAARLETERLTRELAQSRDMVDRLRVQRSDAKEESAGFRAQAESTAAQLHQMQKAHERLEARYEALLEARVEGQG